MKIRHFLLVCLAIFLGFLLIAETLGASMVSQGALPSIDKGVQVPRSARFIPRDVALSFHWLEDSVQLPDSLQAARKNKHYEDISEGVVQLRNGLFALAGFDFDEDLSDWLGSEISLALFQPEDVRGKVDWALILTGRDQDSLTTFFQNFWQIRSLAGQDLHINKYQGRSLITSGKSDFGNGFKQLATALMDDEFLVIASEEAVLHKVIDVSNSPEKNQLADPRLLNDLLHLGNGIAFLTASPFALHSWLDFPKLFTERNDINDFVAVLNPESADLSVEGLLEFSESVFSEGVFAQANDLLSLNHFDGRAEGWALISSPSRLLDVNTKEPVSQWLGSIIREHFFKSETFALENIFGSEEGPLFWLKEPQGWVVGTRADSSNFSAVDHALSTDGFIRSDLTFEGDPLHVWSKLSVKTIQGKDIVTSEVAAILEEDLDKYWWAENLELLAQGKSVEEVSVLLEQLDSKSSQGDNLFPYEISLIGDMSSEIILKWRPWILMKTISGRSFRPEIVQGLEMALGPAQQDGSSALRFHGRISFA